MKTTNNTPTEGVVNQTSVNPVDVFDPIKTQTNIILDMMKEHLELEIDKKEDYIKYLKENNEEDLQYLKYEETELFELKYLNDLITNLQSYTGGGIMKSLRKVVEYLYDVEQQHFYECLEEGCGEEHIYLDILELKKFLGYSDEKDYVC